MRHTHTERRRERETEGQREIERERETDRERERERQTERERERKKERKKDSEPQPPFGPFVCSAITTHLPYRFPFPVSPRVTEESDQSPQRADRPETAAAPRTDGDVKKKRVVHRDSKWKTMGQP